MKVRHEQRFSIPALQFDPRRVVVLVACLALPGVLSGCVVSQTTHEEALQEIKSLQAANRSLKTGLDTAQTQRNRVTHESPPSTDNHRLQDMLARSATILRGQGSAWAIQYRDVPMMVMTSEQHDRMRIIALVGDESLVKDVDFSLLMQANFDRALDARYALFQGKCGPCTFIP